VESNGDFRAHCRANPKNLKLRVKRPKVSTPTPLTTKIRKTTKKHTTFALKQQNLKNIGTVWKMNMTTVKE
jgi:hypothetical protein